MAICGVVVDVKYWSCLREILRCILVKDMNIHVGVHVYVCKMKNRDSLTRNSHFNQPCGVDQDKIRGGQFISRASC